MSVLVGKDGSVSVGGSNLARISSWSVSVEADTLEYTSFDSGGWKDMMGSLLSWSGSCEGFVDSAATPLVVGSTVQLSLSDGSNTYSGSAVITSMSVDASTAELVTVSYDFTGTGQLTY